MNNYFYVDVDEEITSVIGKLRKSDSDEAFLVVPKRAMISQSLVNLRLLDKEAKKLNKKLIFVSPDLNTRKIAEKAGLSVKKYVAKLKEEDSRNTQNDSTLPIHKNIPLQPWEEAAAKEELNNVIKKSEPQPTKIKAGVYSNPKSILSPVPTSILTPPPLPSPPSSNVSFPVGPKKPVEKSKVVDLKTLAAAKRKQFKPELLNEKTRNISNKNGNDTINDGQISEDRSFGLVEEPDLKELMTETPLEHSIEPSIEPTMESSATEQKTPVVQKRPVKPLQIAKVNPFKVKKISKGMSASVPKSQTSPVPIITPATFSDSPPSSIVPTSLSGPSEIKTEANEPTKQFESLPPIVSELTSPTEAEIDEKKIKSFERETASLTMREKEKLRDLWMEQKKVVIGKTFHEGTSLDLKPNQEPEARKEESVEQERGIFQTTHRRVIGTGKVIDLRANSIPLMKLPNLSNDKNLKKNGKEIILPLFNVRLFLVFLLGISAVLLVIIGIILPEATVAIKPKQSSDSLELKLWTSGEVSQIDFTQKIVPGKPVHFKVSEEKVFQTTNNKEIKENSQGQVTIKNQSSQPLSLKENAMLSDANGKKFYLTEAVVVPAAKQESGDATDNANVNTNSSSNLVPGSASGGVSAEGSDKTYNLKEGTALTIPGLKDSDFTGLVTAVVKKDISGGENRTVKVVSQNDLDAAKEELVNKAKEESLDKLTNSLEAEAVKNIKIEDLMVEDVSFFVDKSVGNEADSFSASVSVTFFTVAFSQQDLKDLAKSVIEGDSDEKDGTINVNSYRVSDAKPLENKLEISSNLDYKLESEVNQSDIQRYLVAKKIQEAQDYLRNRSDVENFKLDIWPNFLGHLPVLERRIKVILE